MAVRRSYTAIVERDVLWQGKFASEPYEAAWASEAIFFLRALELSPDFAGGLASVQISADGIHWADEGRQFQLPTAKHQVTFGKVSHFGGWLRITGELPAPAAMRALVSLALKE